MKYSHANTIIIKLMEHYSPLAKHLGGLVVPPYLFSSETSQKNSTFDGYLDIFISDNHVYLEYVYRYTPLRPRNRLLLIEFKHPIELDQLIEDYLQQNQIVSSVELL